MVTPRRRGTAEGCFAHLCAGLPGTARRGRDSVTSCLSLSPDCSAIWRWGEASRLSPSLRPPSLSLQMNWRDALPPSASSGLWGAPTPGGSCVERMPCQESLGVPLLCPCERGSQKPIWGKQTLRLHVSLEGTRRWSSEVTCGVSGCRRKGGSTPLCSRGRRVQLSLPLQWRGVFLRHGESTQFPYHPAAASAPHLQTGRG